MKEKEEKEERIREQRTIEAAQKRLMGLGGKFGLILKKLGQPILAHQEGGIFHDTNYLEDDFHEAAWDDLDGTPEEIQNKIPYMEAGDSEEPTGGAFREERNYSRNPITIFEIGKVFDGLDRGIHLEIKYIEEKKSITVHFKGWLVYQEISGNLLSYVPSKEWEEKIDKLYEIALKREKESVKINKENESVAVIRAKNTFLQRLQERWGL